MVAHIGVVDDHPSMVVGVSAIVNAQPGMEVVAVADTVPSLLASRAALDVVLLDLKLGDSSSPAENVSALTRADAAVIAFTSGENAALVRAAVRSGVVGILRKSESPEGVVRAIGAALRGEIFATPVWVAELIADRRFPDARLTDREVDVLTRYASGQTAEHVAAALFLSRDTILDHLRRIRRRYAAVGRAAPTKVDLHRRAVEDGLVQPTA